MSITNVALSILCIVLGMFVLWQRKLLGYAIKANKELRDELKRSAKDMAA